MKQILVVEDNEDYSELLVNYLSNSGFNVTVASDGLKAFDFMEEREFSLIILDIMLPKIDGFTLCELIRKKSGVPIIMLTAKFSEEDQLKGYQLKVDEYISKISEFIGYLLLFIVQLSKVIFELYAYIAP